MSLLTWHNVPQVAGVAIQVIPFASGRQSIGLRDWDPLFDYSAYRETTLDIYTSR